MCYQKDFSESMMAGESNKTIPEKSKSQEASTAAQKEAHKAAKKEAKKAAKKEAKAAKKAAEKEAKRQEKAKEVKCHPVSLYGWYLLGEGSVLSKHLEALHFGLKIGKSIYHFQANCGVSKGSAAKLPREPEYLEEIGNYVGSKMDLEALLEQLGQEFPAASYGFVTNNCWDFAETLISRLQLSHSWKPWWSDMALRRFAKGKQLESSFETQNENENESDSESEDENEDVEEADEEKEDEDGCLVVFGNVLSQLASRVF